MYPINGVNYFGNNGTMQRQMAPQPAAPAPQAPAPQMPQPQQPQQQPQGLLGASQVGGIPYSSFNSAPGSGSAPQQMISASGMNPSLGMYGMQRSPQPLGMAGASGSYGGSPYAQNSMMGGQFQGGGMNSATGAPMQSGMTSYPSMNQGLGMAGVSAPGSMFGNNPFASNPYSSPYAQNLFGGYSQAAPQQGMGASLGMYGGVPNPFAQGMAGAYSSGSSFGGPFASNPYSLPGS